MNLRSLHLALAALSASTAFAAGTAPATAGEQWEYSQSMEMSGMKMPMPPMKVCTAPSPDVTAPVDKHCQISDIKTVGAHSTWKMKCTGADPMEGTGDFTRHGDQISGTLHTRSKAGEMTMTTSGRKLGACALGQPPKVAP
jgi:hypothetical protein